MSESGQERVWREVELVGASKRAYRKRKRKQTRGSFRAKADHSSRSEEFDLLDAPGSMGLYGLLLGF
jgi:hypothetical protein